MPVFRARPLEVIPSGPLTLKLVASSTFKPQPKKPQTQVKKKPSAPRIPTVDAPNVEYCFLDMEFPKSSPALTEFYTNIRTPGATVCEWAARPHCTEHEFKRTKFVTHRSGCTLKVADGVDILKYYLPDMHNHREFRLGDVVFARFQSMFWPGYIKSFIPGDKFSPFHGDVLMIQWFGDSQYTYVAYADCYHFDLYFYALYNSRRADISYNYAVAEAIAVLGRAGYWEDYISQKVFQHLKDLKANALSSISEANVDRIYSNRVEPPHKKHKVEELIKVIEMREIIHFNNCYKTKYADRQRRFTPHQEMCNSILGIRKIVVPRSAPSDDESDEYAVSEGGTSFQPNPDVPLFSGQQKIPDYDHPEDLGVHEYSDFTGNELTIHEMTLERQREVDAAVAKTQESPDPSSSIGCSKLDTTTIMENIKITSQPQKELDWTTDPEYEDNCLECQMHIHYINQNRNEKLVKTNKKNLAYKEAVQEKKEAQRKEKEAKSASRAARAARAGPTSHPDEPSLKKKKPSKA